MTNLTRIARAEAVFREIRLLEPLDEYAGHFDHALLTLHGLIDLTVDLTEIDGNRALAVLARSDLLEGFRYLAGPPISLDDLKTLAEADSIAPATLRSNPELVRRLVETVMVGLDRRRFPWVAAKREPTSQERDAALLATAALIAVRRTETGRRSDVKREQEERVRRAMLGLGFTQVPVPSTGIATIAAAPLPREFCREVKLGSRKADFVIGLPDRRILAIECKVSNSALNSVKRLNNDAAVKAVVWRREFGERQIVPAATLSGVYKLRGLQDAQDQGLALFWSHRLEDLTSWITGLLPTP